MERLTRDVLAQLGSVAVERPERVIQFGEGNFLRGFVDWMIHQANQREVFDGNVVVVQPIERGLAKMVNEQDGLYTLILRGIENGEQVVQEEVVTSISRALDSYQQWEEVLACAEQPELEIMVSNTTEAGIVYQADDRFIDTPPQSFPGKVCAYLYRRYQAFQGDASKGMVIIPCELIDRNGDKLQKIVLRLAQEWGLEKEFQNWIAEANYFLNTLVDRIVTGYPGQEEARSLWEKMGYEDQLIDTGEIFHLWVIEGPEEARRRFPLHEANLNLKWVEDLTPYRTRKVRILNGAHTSTVPVAYLAGIDSVREAVEDDLVGKYLHKIVFEEIIPTLDLPKEELEEFAGQVMERFMNPFIYHRWLDISLNSISKYKTRVLPSLLAQLQEGQVPELLTLALAALIAFYQGQELTEKGMMAQRGDQEYLVRDNPEVLEFFFGLWQELGRGDESRLEELVSLVLQQTAYWGEDLTQYEGLVGKVTIDLIGIQKKGMVAVLRGYLD